MRRNALCEPGVALEAPLDEVGQDRFDLRLAKALIAQPSPEFGPATLSTPESFERRA